jgi:hypothetical protein
MVVDWAMSTCPETRCVVTSNTDTQLRTKTWPEIAKWTRLLVNADWWKVPATAMYEVGHEKSWRADAIPWSENNTEAFAGLHNEGKRIVLVFDEASAIADKVWEVAEGALTDLDTEIIWLAFGNPTRNTGRFRECFGKYRALWKTRQIDSRTVEGTNKEYLEEFARTYGEDSDIVKVRVRGQFPSQSVTQFIPTDLVTAAQERRLGPVDEGAPLIMGVDVARFGDDQNVIRGRQGRDGKPFKAMKWRGTDTVKSAEKVADAIQRIKPDKVFIDGGGIGGAVVDLLTSWNYAVTEISFGSTAKDEGRYANKRAEMWGDCKDWLVTGAIDDDMELRDDMIGPEYMLDKNGRILLESKADMKSRGLASPDDGDAFCFVAGTVIATPNGDVAIDRIQEGEVVLTPFGPATVRIVHRSYATELTTAEFSNGKALCGKGQHKIFTFTRGMQRLDALSLRSEERRVGKECRSRWSPYH